MTMMAKQGSEKPRWTKPAILRHFTEEELEEELKGRDLRVRGGGNYDQGSGATHFDRAVEP
jgi:hypothetical protein